MNTESFENNDKKSDYISGIYNYCDRWCERCPFTARCLNFEIGEDKFGDIQDGSLSNEVFWQKLSETLQETMTMLKEMAEERGLDLDKLDTNNSEEIEASIGGNSVVHMTTHMARSYIDFVENWFNDNVYAYEAGTGQPESIYKAVSAEWHDPKKTVRLRDALEVIRWYQHQIYVKIQRAIHSSHNEEFESEHGFPIDSDGSAKVALIGMDRSISAWGNLISYFPNQKETILILISHIDRLRRQTEKKFPAARAFVRPGFDEIGGADSLPPTKG